MCIRDRYYYDVETGLYYLQSRYYNPEWGRFINADKTEVMQLSKSSAVTVSYTHLDVYKRQIRIDNGHSGTSWNFIHLHIYKVHIRIPSNAIQYKMCIRDRPTRR